MDILRPQIEQAVKPREVCGAPSFNHAERDLYLHANAPGDSCFVVANVLGDDGNTYNFLIHQGAMMPDGQGAFQTMVVMVSLTDKANRQYLHEESGFAFSACTFAADHLAIQTPNTSLTGTLAKMTLSGQLPEGRGMIEAVLTNEGPVLDNCTNGYFCCMNDLVTFNHYGLPYLKATGTITLDGKTIPFAGDAWLDRQWSSGNLPLLMAEHKVQTKWMDLNLSNGYKVSLWDILIHDGKENAWATILSPDGVYTVAPMTPLAQYESDYWQSPQTGNCYATKYIVELPALQSRLQVQVYEGIPHQEAVSVTGYHRYEAHSTCVGTFMGQAVTGFCCVELVGNFQEPGASE